MYTVEKIRSQKSLHVLLGPDAEVKW